MFILTLTIFTTYSDTFDVNWRLVYIINISLMIIRACEGPLYVASCAVQLWLLFRLLLLDMRWLADALPLHGERVVIRLVYMAQELSHVYKVLIELLMMG